jgi:hypothetical protein
MANQFSKYVFLFIELLLKRRMHGQEGNRLFQEKDRQGVFRIAADSAFYGEPVEKFLDERDRSTKSW